MQGWGWTHIGEGGEVVVNEERRVRPQLLFKPMPYPGQPTPYPGQLTPYPAKKRPILANRRPILPTYIGEGVEVVVDEERRIRPLDVGESQPTHRIVNFLF